MSRLQTLLLVSAVLSVVTCGDGAVEPASADDSPRPTTIVVNPAQVRLVALGATVLLSAEVRDQNGQTMAGVAVTWSSGNPGIATVDATGLVTAASNGTATITASVGSAAGTAAVVVEQEAVTLSLTPEEVMFRALGDTLRLLAEATDANGHPAMVMWSSSDTEVARVDNSGLVTAAGNGTATIAAMAGVHALSAGVTVEQAVVSVGGLPLADTLLWYGDPGDTLRLVAVALDANRHAVAGVQFEWSSSVSSAATVDADGLVRAVAEGTTTITAIADTLQAKTELAVVNRDRAALVALYHATDGPNWKRNGNWLTGRWMGDWEGVTTELRHDGVPIVTRLWLPSNNLKGTVPRELWTLTNLERLVLQDSGLRGAIPPEVGNLTNLYELHVSIHLTSRIPTEIGNLEGLKRLILNGRGANLGGPIPPEIGNLVDLERLWLYALGLTGPIPLELASLASLETLILGRNAFAGTVPTWLSDLKRLRSLDLSSNELEGSIPPELAALASLETLALGHNTLTGTIPRWLSSFERLRILTLESNELEGPIPPELGSLERLEWLLLDRNALSGSIPPELGNLKRLEYLRLGDNSLTGPIPPEMGSMRALGILSLGNNALSGVVPPEIGKLENLNSLLLHQNGLTGPLPETLTALSLESFWWFETDLCSPRSEGFQQWLQGISNHRAGSPCPP